MKNLTLLICLVLLSFVFCNEQKAVGIVTELPKVSSSTDTVPSHGDTMHTHPDPDLVPDTNNIPIGIKN